MQVKNKKYYFCSGDNPTATALNPTGRGYTPTRQEPPTVRESVFFSHSPNPEQGRRNKTAYKIVSSPYGAHHARFGHKALKCFCLT